ncbi:MAG TPA: thioredoxin domain-containing protein [Gammaproteobacteria bacterium]|nr:thioredoxin domain-containing protein [Gammaproteobacteria bacterium]
MNTAPHRNRLAGELSPYLRRHARQPVDWYPWNAQALARARREERPILLSIGYSACHWCHVMAHECFDDEAVAALMNRLFVNIKVDREERPDLDKIYQSAHHILTQRSGGWPLTVFLTPDQQLPFFSGTYFPKTPRHGLPAFPALLEQVAAYFATHRDEIEQQGDRVHAVFAQLQAPTPLAAANLDALPLDAARAQLGQAFDKRHGGFGGAPKFPHPGHIERLLRHWHATGAADEAALAMATHTLDQMATGGLFDHLGGGFFRYAVDEGWEIPHFEKMLCDNGPLLARYAQAWQVTGKAIYRTVAETTAAWVQREMQGPEGGYYSTLDADDPAGGEGAFYLWDRQEIATVLGPADSHLFATCYSLDETPDFEGRWHLRQRAPLTVLGPRLDLAPAALDNRLRRARERLFAVRERRPRPARDEKILTGWNGLMISAMATAGWLLEREDYLASASRALDFIRAELWQEGRLWAVYKDGQRRQGAFLDDYAFLIDGILALAQARWRDGELDFAAALADVLLARFQDPAGGFFFTADDHEPLIHRPKPWADDATPAGNGIAAQALLRLGQVLGHAPYLEAAGRTVRAAWNAMGQLPHAHGSLLGALEALRYPAELLIIRGDEERCAHWRRRLARRYAPRRYSLVIPHAAAALPGRLARCPAAGEWVAYVCRGSQCDPPLNDTAALERLLTAGEHGGP